MATQQQETHPHRLASRHYGDVGIPNNTNHAHNRPIPTEKKLRFRKKIAFKQKTPSQNLLHSWRDPQYRRDMIQSPPASSPPYTPPPRRPPPEPPPSDPSHRTHGNAQQGTSPQTIASHPHTVPKPLPPPEPPPLMQGA